MPKSIILIVILFIPFLSLAQEVEDQVDSLSTQASEVFTIVEESATFPGGMNGFYRFLAVNIKYPALATMLKVEGRVFVQFIVEKDGSISNIQVVKGIGAGCDEEAARVIQLMPNWIPGKYNGEPVRQKMVQAISFVVAKNERDSKKKMKELRKKVKN
ncbi:MAG: energy transducer TonB [Bacteroidota bacterium]